MFYHTKCVLKQGPVDLWLLRVTKAIQGLFNRLAIILSCLSCLVNTIQTRTKIKKIVGYCFGWGEIWLCGKINYVFFIKKYVEILIKDREKNNNLCGFD